jgi:hypothetical protein
MQSYNIVKTISRKITSVDGDNIISLFENSAVPQASRISLNGFVKNLKAFSKISSLAAINLPVFELEDSESQKLFKTLDIEFNSPRKQMDLFIGSGNEWNQMGSISLLNPSGYPYRMYNLLDFYTDGLAAELGENGKIGVKITDVGYGLLSGADAVTIHGSYIQEFVIESPQQGSNSNYFMPSITVGRTTTLDPGKPATVVNSGSSTNVVLDFGIPRGADGENGTGVITEEEDMGFGGIISCKEECSIEGSGKAFLFYAPQTNLKLVIAPGFEIDITTANNAIELHRWSQEPNEDLDGREWVGELPQTGGILHVDITSTYRWISVFAKNPGSDDSHDAVCFEVSGNTLTLLGFY